MPSTPTRPGPRPRAARRARTAPGSVSVPRPAGLAVVEGPLGHAALVVVERVRRGVGTTSPRRRRRAAARHVAAEASRAGCGAPRRDLRRRSGAAGELAAQGVECRGALLPLARRLGLVRIRTVRLPITSATTSITPNVTRYRASLTAKVK